MKNILITTIAAVLLFWFGESQLSSAATEETPVADAAKSEPATANFTTPETPSTLAKSQEAEFNRQTSLGMDIATNLAVITGIAISPLFGMSAVSCYMYYGTSISQRQNLPWYNSPMVWGTGFCIWFLFLVNTMRKKAFSHRPWIRWTRKPEGVHLYSASHPAIGAMKIISWKHWPLRACWMSPFSKVYATHGGG
ncbi:hypothetical protein N8546_00610 [bacterium]|nr:hypothetical protein [bacterium]